MENVIILLKEKRKEHERSFIENSLIIRQSVDKEFKPNTEYDLTMIYELNQAISILQNQGMAKDLTNQQHK
jgi:hypothetical protein